MQKNGQRVISLHALRRLSPRRLSRTWVTLLAYKPVASGALTGKYAGTSRYTPEQDGGGGCHV